MLVVAEVDAIAAPEVELATVLVALEDDRAVADADGMAEKTDSVAFARPYAMVALLVTRVLFATERVELFWKRGIVELALVMETDGRVELWAMVWLEEATCDVELLVELPELDRIVLTGRVSMPFFLASMAACRAAICW